MTSVSNVNPYYGINQAGGIKPTDAAKAATQEAAGLDESPVAKKDVAQDFLDYAKMSIPERIRKKYLEDNNLTEEDLAKLAAEERKKIEEEIKLAIEEAVKRGMREAGTPIDSIGSIANIVA